MQQAEFATRLLAIRAVHTVVWAFFVGCILAIPIFGWFARFRTAASLIAVTAVEVLVILLNSGRCPLTGMAARYTEDRRANFDIYLPEWLARNNKRIFGTLYGCGILVTALLWNARRP